jgi:hypothetical protein
MEPRRLPRKVYAPSKYSSICARGYKFGLQIWSIIRAGCCWRMANPRLRWVKESAAEWGLDAAVKPVRLTLGERSPPLVDGR